MSTQGPTTVVGTGTEPFVSQGYWDRAEDYEAGKDLATGLEKGAVIAIKRGYRIVRLAVLDSLRNEGTADFTSSMVILSVCPVLSALTGRTQDQIIESELKRLEADGLINIKTMAGKQVIVVKGR